MGWRVNHLLLGMLLGCLSLLSHAAAREPIVIAGGDIQGVYFQIAGELCRLAIKQQPLVHLQRLAADVVQANPNLTLLTRRSR